MKCEVEWLRVTDSQGWACARSGSVRHYNSPETVIVPVGQQTRKRPDDFDIIYKKLLNVTHLHKHYHAGHGTVVRWISEHTEERAKACDPGRTEPA